MMGHGSLNREGMKGPVGECENGRSVHKYRFASSATDGGLHDKSQHDLLSCQTACPHVHRSNKSG